MRLGGWIALVLGLACASGVRAGESADEHTFTYKSGVAYDTNYFADTNRLSAISLRAGFGLNGKVALDGRNCVMRSSMKRSVSPVIVLPMNTTPLPRWG